MTHTRRRADLAPEDVLRRTAGVVESLVNSARKSRKSRGNSALAAGGFAPDSLAKINLIIALEAEFGFEIDEATVPASALDTVAKLAQFVHAQLRSR